MQWFKISLSGVHGFHWLLFYGYFCGITLILSNFTMRYGVLLICNFKNCLNHFGAIKIMLNSLI